MNGSAFVFLFLAYLRCARHREKQHLHAFGVVRLVIFINYPSDTNKGKKDGEGDGGELRKKDSANGAQGAGKQIFKDCRKDSQLSLSHAHTATNYHYRTLP